MQWIKGGSAECHSISRLHVLKIVYVAKQEATLLVPDHMHTPCKRWGNGNGKKRLCRLPQRLCALKIVYVAKQEAMLLLPDHLHTLLKKSTTKGKNEGNPSSL